jgi:hypothetical protein
MQTRRGKFGLRQAVATVRLSGDCRADLSGRRGWRSWHLQQASKRTHAPQQAASWSDHRTSGNPRRSPFPGVDGAVGRITDATEGVREYGSVAAGGAGAAVCGADGRVSQGLRSDPLDGTRFTREYSDLVEKSEDGVPVSSVIGP